MKFYTSVDLYKNHILLRGYENGRQVKEEVKYKPSLFVTTKKQSKFESVYGHPVEKIEFDSIYSARDFLRQYKDVSGFPIFGSNNFAYSFIYDYYPKQVQYDVDLIRKCTIDIETDSSDGFPDIEQANRAIISITMITKTEILVFGMKDFKTSDPKVKYFKFMDEEAMLASFLSVWENQNFDVVTGWNIELFDIPYLINRIRSVLGPTEVLRLSPWKRLQERKVVMRGREYQAYTPVGIAVLDYLPVFKKFTGFVYGQLESYSLDYVSFFILGEKKLGYSEYGSLHKFYEQNFQKFIEYNIRDCLLVDMIDEKERLLELVYAISYDAKVNYEDSLASVKLWDTIIINYLMDRNKVVPQFISTKSFDSIPGGYVKDVKIGLSRWVVSFDLTSLYPHLIMQNNISPETLVEKDEPFYSIEDLIDKNLKFRDYAYAANGCKFKKDQIGFLPALMKMQFNLRAEYRKRMMELKKEAQKSPSSELEREISALNNAQMAKKIQLNSLYGSLANEWCRWFSPDLASAITLSGQLAVRWVEKDLNILLNKTLSTKDVDYVIAIDTDSVYLNLEPLVNFSLKGKQKTDSEVATFLDKVSKTLIEPAIEKSYELLAIKMNAYEQAMKMKREAIANKAIWVAKKRYIANVIDNEGVRYAEPELKIMGIEAVRSSTPSAARSSIKEALRVIMNREEVDVQKFIADKRMEFMTLPVEDIAFPRGINGVNKYRDAARVYKSGTPIHVRAALLYNKLLRENNLLGDYGEISDKDKIKFVYLKMPNPVKENVIAFPSEIPKPLHFLNEYVDRDLQFEKGFLEPVKTILDSIGWQVEKINTLEDFFS